MGSAISHPIKEYYLGTAGGNHSNYKYYSHHLLHPLDLQLHPTNYLDIWNTILECELADMDIHTYKKKLMSLSDATGRSHPQLIRLQQYKYVTVFHSELQHR